LVSLFFCFGLAVQGIYIIISIFYYWQVKITVHRRGCCNDEYGMLVWGDLSLPIGMWGELISHQLHRSTSLTPPEFSFAKIELLSYSDRALRIDDGREVFMTGEKGGEPDVRAAENK